MYHLYDIKMSPSPQDATPPYHIPQWKDLQLHFCTESLSGDRNLGPSIHKCHRLHSLYHNHSLIGMAK